MTQPTILIVDDEPIITGMLSMVLDLSLQVKTIATNSPIEACAILGRGGVSLLLTDYLMPQLNGLSLIRMARQQGITIPAMLLTGYCEEPELAANADILQPFEVIVKPWNNESLVRRIKFHLPNA